MFSGTSRNIEYSFNLNNIYEGSLQKIEFNNLDSKFHYYMEVLLDKKYSYNLFSVNNKNIFIFGIPLNYKGKGKIRIYKYDKNRKNSFLVLEIYFNIKELTRKTTNLTINKKYVSKKVDKKLLNRIENEYFLVNEKKKEFINKKYFSGIPIFPIKNGKISSPFGAIRVFNGIKKSEHHGVDISSPIGTPIYSTFGGKVTLIKNLYYSGNTIIINSGYGLVFVYAHLSKTMVKEGETVVKGQKIGEVGKTGRVTGPHLHFGMYINNICVDPLSLFEVFK